MSPAADAGAVIVAAGIGARAGGAAGVEPKQYREIAGVRMLLRAVRPFAAHPRVGPIVVVLPEADAASPPSWLAPLLSDRLTVVAGGATRQQSVANGLARLAPSAQIVLVHDAARPFADADLIDRVLEVAMLGAAAIPAMPVCDTIKETDTAGLVTRSLARERLVSVQTPQAFPRQMLETAHQRSRSDPNSAAASDDATLCERLGYPVRVVPGDARNLKVTSPSDFVIAEALAAERGAAEPRSRGAV